MFKTAEKRLRTWRRAAGRRLMSGPGARKFLLDLLPTEIDSMTVQAGDHSIAFNPHELVGRRIFTHGHFERPHTETILKWLDANGFLGGARSKIVEIGANIGTQSVYMALNPRVGAVIAIEPDPRNIDLLEANVRRNGFEGRITVVPLAVGEEQGEKQLYSVEGNSGNSSLLPLPGSRPAAVIKTLPLSAILAQTKTAPNEVALVWVDVEGYEPELWPQIADLASSGCAVHMEFSPVMYGRQKTEAFIRAIAARHQTVHLFEGGRQKQVATTALADVRKQADILIADPTAIS